MLRAFREPYVDTTPPSIQIKDCYGRIAFEARAYRARSPELKDCCGITNCNLRPYRARAPELKDCCKWIATWGYIVQDRIVEDERQGKEWKQPWVSLCFVRKANNLPKTSGGIHTSSEAQFQHLAPFICTLLIHDHAPQTLFIVSDIPIRWYNVGGSLLAVSPPPPPLNDVTRAPSWLIRRHRRKGAWWKRWKHRSWTVVGGNIVRWFLWSFRNRNWMRN